MSEFARSESSPPNRPDFPLAATVLGIALAAGLAAISIAPALAAEVVRVQSGAASLPPSAHVALSPGTYSSSQWSLRLTSDDFELRDVDGAVVAAGGYDVQDGMLIMTSSGAEEAAEEIRCRVGLFGPGIRLRDEDGTCTDLDGAVLQKEW